MTVGNLESGQVVPTINGYASSNRHSVAYSGSTTRYGDQSASHAANGGTPKQARFPHIKDLQEKAETAIRTADPHIPIRSLLNNARQSITQVGTDVSFKRPDRAYVEYLIGSELLLNVIPKHEDYPAMMANGGETQKIYMSLRMKVNSQHEMVKQIYNAIVEDNANCGVNSSGQPSTTRPLSSSLNRSRPLTNEHPRPLSMPDTPTALTDKAEEELFFTTPKPDSRTSTGQISQSQQSSILRKERPIVQPKPQALQSYLKTNGEISHSVSGDDLFDRFSQIRIQRKPAQSSIISEGRNGSHTGSSVKLSDSERSPTHFKYSSSVIYEPQRTSVPLSSPGKPSGPRKMLPPGENPRPPPKIPLDAQTHVEMPRAPAPAYDPAKTVVTPIKTTAPTLNRKRSIIGADNASSPSMLRTSGHGLPKNDLSPSHTFSNSNDECVSRQVPLDPLGPSKTITAAQLYECLQTFSVLLIDVRSRTEYDQGHIFAKSIICIEPLGLKPGFSAEELEDRLVISPETEQTLFERRNEFDWVVYYDQKTNSDSFLSGPPTRTQSDALRALHDTLYEFNDYRPLHRPPVMLKGGLDAWVDLVGPQALSTSDTAALTESTRVQAPLRKHGRPIGRVPMASANSSLEVRKRRLRDQQPLNADEEKSWLEKAHREEVDPADYRRADSDADTDSNGEEPISPFVHTYEDFLRRFPEAQKIQQSMITAPPPLPQSQSPLSPPPRTMPTVPSRPAPAVPRPSYSGVSERSAQFPANSRQPSSTYHPLYTSKSTVRYLKLPRTGLVNFSVTCYMNATIQCLVATIPISQFFLGDRWKGLTQKNWKGSDGIMPRIFANLIQNLWQDNANAIRPSSLRNFCARLKPEWGIDKQQDAKEYFDFLVDCLHEDLNEMWQRNPLQPLTFQQEMERERMPIPQVSRIEWERYTHREKSYISDIFAGQHASRLRCTTCQNSSTTYEAFYSISVEIPRSAGKYPWDIHDCLRSYCQEEKLSGDEVWKCPYCKCEREATKKITITRAPQFLVMHFKRFEMRKGENARKVHTPIGFPLFGLNMEPYMIPQSPKSNPAANHIEQYHDPATTPPYLYDAYAVMRHIGSSGNGGHYISLVRDAARGNIWRKFDDDRVTDFDPNKLKPDQRLQNEQAYLVFYGRAVAR